MNSALLVVEIIKDNVPEPLYELVLRMERLDILGNLLELSEIKDLGTTYILFEFLWSIQLFQHRLIKKFEESFFK